MDKEELKEQLGLRLLKLCDCGCWQRTDWTGKHMECCSINKLADWIWDKFEPRAYLLHKRS